MKLRFGLLATVFALAGTWRYGECHRTSTRGIRYLDVPGNRPVNLVYDTSSTRYQLNTTVGAEEWAGLLPSGGHLVRMKEGDETQLWTVAMLHQLRCLNILREDYVMRKVSPLQSHCLNYIRQSVLCLADTHLEYSKNGLAVTHYIESVCNDWTAVYSATERNAAGWKELHETTP
ncbi:hypothetical protein PsYK624_117950 [Phanerochaete sordida]|uniref:Uncharacterized protein n=1 Tax=Phanerochaete sordida TaxID=48140 RepID=A0A9P3GJV7_9APHY|nr:hypothetical protein PsYK624_117950 [Phanerochaete sordida]